MPDIDPALRLVRRGIDRVTRPYIAFSGGKDSLAVAHLVSQVDDSIPMVYCDDEMLYPEHVAYIDAAKDRFGDRLRLVQGASLHRGWFRPWAPGGDWWREPHPDMEWLSWATGRNVTSGELAARLGYDSVFLGLRRQESVRRSNILHAATGIDRLSSITYINPIIDWSDADVWDYVRGHDLAYCAVYDRLSEIGVSTHHARLGPLPLSDGMQLAKGWPRLFVQLVRRYGNRWPIPLPPRRIDTRPPKGVLMIDWLDIQDAIREAQ